MSSGLTDYVVGFAFEGPHVLLIQKSRPAWQHGRLNGVGGHVEDGELPVQAMQREFFEETGLFTSVRVWRPFAVVHTEKSRVFMFRAYVSLRNATAKTDEPVRVVEVAQVRDLYIVPNLAWLIPLALRADDLPVPAVVHETASYETAA